MITTTKIVSVIKAITDKKDVPAYNINDDLDDYSSDSASEPNVNDPTKETNAVLDILAYNAIGRKTVDGISLKLREIPIEADKLKYQQQQQQTKSIKKNTMKRKRDIITGDGGDTIQDSSSSSQHHGNKRQRVLSPSSSLDNNATVHLDNRINQDPLWNVIRNDVLNKCPITAEELKSIARNSFYGKDFYDYYMVHISDAIREFFQDCPDMGLTIYDKNPTFMFNYNRNKLSYQSVLYIEFLGTDLPPPEWDHTFKTEAPYVDVIPCRRMFKPCQTHGSDPWNVRANNGDGSPCKCSEVFLENEKNPNLIIISGPKRKSNVNDKKTDPIRCYRIIINYIGIERHPDDFDSRFSNAVDDKITATSATADNKMKNKQKDMATAACNALGISPVTIDGNIDDTGGRRRRKHEKCDNDTNQSKLNTFVVKAPSQQTKKRKTKKKQPQEKEEKKEEGKEEKQSVKWLSERFETCYYDENKVGDCLRFPQILTMNDINKYIKYIKTIHTHRKRHHALGEYFFTPQFDNSAQNTDFWLRNFLFSTAFTKFTCMANDTHGADPYGRSAIAPKIKWTQKSIEGWQKHPFTVAYGIYLNRTLSLLKKREKSLEKEMEVIGVRAAAAGKPEATVNISAKLQRLSSFIKFFTILKKHRVIFTKVTVGELRNMMIEPEKHSVKFHRFKKENNVKTGEFTNAITGVKMIQNDYTAAKIILITYKHKDKKEAKERKKMVEKNEVPLIMGVTSSIPTVTMITGVIEEKNLQIAEILNQVLQYTAGMRVASKLEEFPQTHEEIEQAIDQFIFKIDTFHKVITKLTSS